MYSIQEYRVYPIAYKSVECVQVYCIDIIVLYCVGIKCCRGNHLTVEVRYLEWESSLKQVASSLSAWILSLLSLAYQGSGVLQA